MRQGAHNTIVRIVVHVPIAVVEVGTPFVVCRPIVTIVAMVVNIAASMVINTSAREEKCQSL